MTEFRDTGSADRRDWLHLLIKTKNNPLNIEIRIGVSKGWIHPLDCSQFFTTYHTVYWDVHKEGQTMATEVSI